jgi:hypothetical protein
MHRLLISLWLAAAVGATVAQVPEAELAKPPAGARHFVIQSTGGKHGDSWRWTAADGTRMGRESMNLRGQVFELDSSGTAGADGLPATITIRGVTPTGDAAETFSVSAGKAVWKSPIDAGTANYSAPAFYVAQGGPIDQVAWLLEGLLASPGQSLDLLPGGKARAARMVDLAVGAGAARQTITLWAVTGLSTSPIPIWADAQHKFFALTAGLDWLPEAYAGDRRPSRTRRRKRWRRGAGLAKALVKVQPREDDEILGPLVRTQGNNQGPCEGSRHDLRCGEELAMSAASVSGDAGDGQAGVPHDGAVGEVTVCGPGAMRTAR